MSNIGGHDRITVQGGHGDAVHVPAGHYAHVVNSVGKQVIDMWAVTWPGGDHFLSTSRSRVTMGRIAPRQGDVLVDDLRRPLLKLVEDTSPGVHDTLAAACDDSRYRELGFAGKHRTCNDNFCTALATLGIPYRVAPDPVNLFQAVPVGPDGSFELATSPAEAGAEVVFEALQDLVLVLSACPMDIVPINGGTVDGAAFDAFVSAPAD